MSSDRYSELIEEFRKVLSNPLLCREIEEYVNWKMVHLNEDTTQFPFVHANIQPDLPLPWTVVQFYIACILTPLFNTRKIRQNILQKIAFPNSQNSHAKIHWIRNYSMINNLLCHVPLYTYKYLSEYSLSFIAFYLQY